MSDTTPSDSPPVPAYGEDDEAASLSKQNGAVPAAPPPATPPVEAAGTTETDIERNVATAAARTAAQKAEKSV